MTDVRYRPWPHRDDFAPKAVALLETTRPTTVADLGGGANPIVPLDVVERLGIDYVVIDQSGEELDKAPAGYRKQIADLTEPGFASTEQFDIVVSRWVLEHLADPAVFHREVFRSLRPGGRALHFFPTLYALPFLANWLLPERVADPILHLTLPHRAHHGHHGKFRSYYRWCRGPSDAQIRRFTDIGYEVEEYTGYFGNEYYRRIPRLQRAEDRMAEFLARRPLGALTSYGEIVLRRPA